jgi:hypothetical protein
MGLGGENKASPAPVDWARLESESEKMNSSIGIMRLGKKAICGNFERMQVFFWGK